MNNWYKTLKRSKYNPPSWVFGIVWPILYLLMFISFILAANKCKKNCKANLYFIIQFIFNLLWSPLFFKFKKPFLALLDLILILFFTVLLFFEYLKINKLSSYLLIPYLCWLSFALYLNTYIVLNN